MTHIPGTSQVKSLLKNENKKADQPKIIGIYKKEDKKEIIQRKLTTNSTVWYLERKYWLWTGLSLSLFCVVLGFTIYKSFFILAIFIPISLLAIWYLIKMFEEYISKLDSFSK